MDEDIRIIGKSPHIKDLLDFIKISSKTDHNILILGDTGVGKELAAKIDTAFQQSAQLVGNINQPLKTAVTDEKQRPMILELRSTLSALKGLIGRELANELNLSLGFNSLDGD